MLEQTRSFERISGARAAQPLLLTDGEAENVHGHFVQFYETDTFLVNSVNSFIGKGIKDGHRGLVIATKPHVMDLKRQLRTGGIDVDSATASGQLTLLDAEETLAKFMLGGSIDKNLFQKVIGGIIARIGTGAHDLRVFGEMVSLLWRAGNHSAAIRLEEFWNELAKKHSFSLLCAYPVHDFDGPANGYGFSQICREHSHFLPLEDFVTAKLSPNEHLREMALLQERADAMEVELKELQEREVAAKRLAAIVESSDDAIIFKDLNGIIRTWNKGAERIFGYTAEEAVGKPVTILFPADHLDEEPGILARIRSGERVDHYETVRKHKDGHLLDISLTVSPVKDDEGKIIGASKIARDITERKRSERQVAIALEREKAAMRMKDDFLATLSHELRTPINPVLLIASDRAADTSLPQEIRAEFETIQKNVEIQARLVDDLLDLSRITHGKMNLNFQTVDVHATLQAVMPTVREAARSKGVQTILKLDADRHFISGDPVRLQQIFWNLLNNAVKFTPQGGCILVESQSRPERDSLNIRFTDTGIGMTPDELKRIFEPFEQGNHAGEKASEYGGLGLGLAISKRLVEMHSGRIEAASEGNNRGTTFSVEFPLNKNRH